MAWVFNPFTGTLDYSEAAGAGTGDITAVTAGTGLSGGGTAGAVTLNLANTAVSAGSYTYAGFTVDAQGRLTAASSGTAPVTSVSATGPITSSGGTTPTVSTSMATNRLLGRGTAGTGVAEEITLGTNLSLSGTTLNATGGGATNLDSLTDVVITSATNGQVLKYDSVSSAWVNDTIAGGGTPGGSDTQIQFNDGGAFGGDADLTYNKTTNLLTSKGDVRLDDGASFTTTLQCITPTAARTISLPDLTGTVALVSGSSGQLIWNNAGAYAGASTLTYDGSILTTSGRFINSYNSAASAPAKLWSGTIFAGTTPHVLIQPTGATTPTSTNAWSSSGTALAVNTAASFGGNLLDLQVNGTRSLLVSAAGDITLGNSGIGRTITVGKLSYTSGALQFDYAGGTDEVRIRANSAGDVALGFFNNSTALQVRLVTPSGVANTLEQRNGTNAQTFRVYGTESSSLANHVRASLSCSSTAVTLAAESAGTGAANVPINLTAKGTGTVKVNSVAEVAVSSTVAGLPAAPAVGMLTRVTDATAPAVGSTVAGGGSAAALCWYNGTNWTVIGV